MSVDVGTGGTKSEPNVVPLCDILLVLLIIFMVITPVAQRGIDIQLPETQQQEPGQQPPDTGSKVVLTIEKDLSILINQTPTPKDMLGSRLKELFGIRQDKTVFIRADISVTYNDVLSVIDIAKGAGIEVLGVMTNAYETGDGTPIIPQ